MVATLRDVARAAGVSPATASRALTSPEVVTPARRALVEQAARELGYRPNLAARELTTGRTGNLCLVVPDLANPFFAGVAKGVQRRARELGRAVFVADSDEDPHVEAELLERLSAQADGTLVCSPRMSDDELEALTADHKVVLVNRQLPGRPSVVIDNTDGMRQAVRHLHALGHRRIGYAGGPVGSWSDARRRDGLEVASHGLHRVEVVDLGHFPPTVAGGTAAGDLVAAEPITAVVAHNDLVALGISARLRARGYRVPEDVSVVGFDDTVATLSHPALTTVGIRLDRLGSAAVDVLIDGRASTPRASGENDVLLPVELVVRASTGPAPTNAAPTTPTTPRKSR